MNLARAIALFLFLVMMSTAQPAQQPEAPVVFGGLRVPACTASPDPEYGLVPSKPIQIGGGPSYADSRMARFIGALRGPQGEKLTIANSRGSLFAPLGYWNEPTILDSYGISYEGKSFNLYVDDYHYSLPKAPFGLTCGGPLVTALGIPPLDPMKASSNLVALAIEQGSVKEVVPVTLDPAKPRGYLMDQFTMIAGRARAAAAAGTPLDSVKPPAGLDPAGLVVLAYPVSCGGRDILPQNIEMISGQASVPRIGELIRGEAVGKMFVGMAGVATPANSLAARFRQAQVTQVRITYSEPCEGNSAEVLLTLRVDPPRIMAVPGTIPQGISEADPTIYVQVILDTEGRFVRPLHIGGPKSLLSTAIDTIHGWRTEPLRLNGTPNINPMILQVIFR